MARPQTETVHLLVGAQGFQRVACGSGALDDAHTSFTREVTCAACLSARSYALRRQHELRRLIA